MDDGTMYVSLKSNLNNKFLRCKVEKGEYQGFIQSSGDEKLDPKAKFAVELSTTQSGLVHLRSCYNNKYLVRSAADGDWIVVGANEKEEDRSKWSCTLFGILDVKQTDGASDVDAEKATNVRFQHAQSRLYACLSKATNAYASDESNNIYAGLSKSAALDDGDLSDTYTVIYWTEADNLPQYVAFKHDNGTYVYRNSEGHILYGASDIGDSGVGHEIIKYEGRMLIKHMRVNRYWEYQPIAFIFKFIVSATVDPQYSQRRFAFDATRVSAGDTDYVICLKNLAANSFCGYCGGNMQCGFSRISRETRLTIEEPIVLRTIYDVVYDYDNARIYDLNDVDVLIRTYKNPGSNPDTYTLQVNYQHSRSKTWNSTVGAKLGVKTEIKAGIPFLANGKIETSLEISGQYQWGKTETETHSYTDTFPVTVPPGKQRTARCVGSKGKCDIPFTYVQIDLLYNGQTITKELGDGIYSAANYYHFSFDGGIEVPISSTDA